MPVRRTLIVTAAFMAVFEAVSIPFTVPFFAALFAVLFAAGAVRYARCNGIAWPILLVLLFGVELAGLPAYSRTNAFDWVTQMTMGVVSAVGLVAAIGVLVQRRRATLQPS